MMGSKHLYNTVLTFKYFKVKELLINIFFIVNKVKMVVYEKIIQQSNRKILHQKAAKINLSAAYDHYTTCNTALLSNSLS